MVFDFYSHNKCPRVIRANKYERQSPETFNWWLRLFQLMETEFTIPPHKRKEVVRAIFPAKIFEKIVSLLTLIEGDLSEQTRPQSSVTFRSAKSERESKLALSADVKSVGTKVTLLGSIDEQPKKPGQFGGEISDTLFKRKEAGPNNPYIRFFNRKPERAAIWRDLPPLSLEEMNLAQKSEAITEAIAVDFIDWLLKLGGETNTTLDVPQVMKMFEIGFNTHAATSLEALVKEMPAVTKSVAEARALPETAIRPTLHRKLDEDVKLFSQKAKTSAFGTSLPSEMRYTPPKVNPTSRWFRSRVNKRLQSMAAVWDGITDLRSTRAFCKWMMDHPELPAPKYLEDLGMLRPSFYDQPHYSIETQESVEMFTKGLGAASEILRGRLK